MSIEGIRTVMNDIRFAYCEYPKSWGMVDSDGTCSVKVEGARVGISYDIIVNTAQLMRIVNHGVELSKDESKVNELKEKVQKRWQERGQQNGQENEPKGEIANGFAHRDDEHDEFKSPEPSPKGEAPKVDHSAADAAVDKAFGGGLVFGAWGGGEAESESDEEDYDDARENQQHKRTSSISESLLGGIASLQHFGGGDSDSELLGGGVGSIAADQPRRSTATPGGAAQRGPARGERHRALLRDLLGDDFVVNDPVMELGARHQHPRRRARRPEIGGTSAAWLYNMIALVLTQQLGGTIEDRINNLTVRQLAGG